MTNEQRARTMRMLATLRPRDFKGSMEDFIKFHEMWCLRIGPDDDWLEELYKDHTNLTTPFLSTT